MVKIEKIANGYIAIFKNSENITIKLYFQSISSLAEWLNIQFETKKEEK